MFLYKHFEIAIYGPDIFFTSFYISARIKNTPECISLDTEVWYRLNSVRFLSGLWKLARLLIVWDRPGDRAISVLVHPLCMRRRSTWRRSIEFLNHLDDDSYLSIHYRFTSWNTSTSFLFLARSTLMFQRICLKRFLKFTSITLLSHSFISLCPTSFIEKNILKNEFHIDIITLPQIYYKL